MGKSGAIIARGIVVSVHNFGLRVHHIINDTPI